MAGNTWTEAVIAPYLVEYLPICKEFEGEEPSMYLDSRGNVTVGVGFLLATASAACQLPFHMTDGTSASPEAITEAWERVKVMVPNRPARFYFYIGCLYLSEGDIDTRLMALLEQSQKELEHDFPKFNSWPDAAKMGATDMDFNLGETKLRKKYPKFDTAADRADFRTMASECHRNGIADERNAWTREQFVIASRVPSPLQMSS